MSVSEIQLVIFYRAVYTDTLCYFTVKRVIMNSALPQKYRVLDLSYPVVRTLGVHNMFRKQEYLRFSSTYFTGLDVHRILPLYGNKVQY